MSSIGSTRPKSALSRLGLEQFGAQQRRRTPTEVEAAEAKSEVVQYDSPKIDDVEKLVLGLWV